MRGGGGREAEDALFVKGHLWVLNVPGGGLRQDKPSARERAEKKKCGFSARRMELFNLAARLGTAR